MFTAVKRLSTEYKQLRKNPPEGILAGPRSEENLFYWDAVLVYFFIIVLLMNVVGLKIHRMNVYYIV